MDYAEEQRQHWNSASGHAWVASQIRARLFEALADRLADLAAARRPDQLLHVGCRTDLEADGADATAASHASWSVSGRP
jgi:hypothetical protein